MSAIDPLIEIKPFLGYWVITPNGLVWFPNSALKMSADEQLAANKMSSPDFSTVKKI
jgi:hypothetical protein